MIRTYKKIMIDEDRLKSLINSTGHSCSYISREMGYVPQTLPNKIRKGYILQVDANYLELAYGIKQEQYELINETDEPANKPKLSGFDHLTQAQIEKSFANALDEYDAIDYERLYKVIYSATYEAMKIALGDDKNDE